MRQEKRMSFIFHIWIFKVFVSKRETTQIDHPFSSLPFQQCYEVGKAKDHDWLKGTQWAAGLSEGLNSDLQS